jgi:sec-independent protein translocase protein TatC
MPILAFFLARLGVLNSKFLIDYARHSIVIIFLVAAFLTPPDIVTQFLMAGPLMFLYFISYLVVKLSEKKS